VGLDQLAIVRALTRSVGTLQGSASPLPLAQAAWLYALLASLQLPLLASTAAVLRELYLAMRDQRRVARPEDLPAPSLLCILAGRFFGQAWEG
jgi:hypothetical protein